MGYIEGIHRDQQVLFPEALDDYVTEDNPVRVIDAFVEQLDLNDLGFQRTRPPATGRPAYDPRSLLKLYMYGYLNKIRSSRRLEQETHRNVELMWLLRKLTPDFKTIADFRKDNLQAFKPLFRTFTLLCRDLGLFSGELIAVDGSKFKAVNNRDRNFTRKKLERVLARIDERVGEYLAQLDHSDACETSGSPALTSTSITEAMTKLTERRDHYTKLLKQLDASGDTQISLTDPDSRSLPKSPKVDVGYTVEVAVDSKHKLIVAQDVTNDVTDHAQLYPTAQEAKANLDVAHVNVVADKGFYNGEQTVACETAGITWYVAKPLTSRNTANGLYGKERFRYDSAHDCYVCPAGQALPFHFETTEEGRQIRYYWTTACHTCAVRSHCTRTREYRRIKRWADEAYLEAMAERVAAQPGTLKQRKTLVEHPFGTIKQWWDQGYFLMRGLVKVRAEFSLTTLAYNLKRVLNIVGVPALLQVIRTWRGESVDQTAPLSHSSAI